MSDWCVSMSPNLRHTLFHPARLSISACADAMLHPPPALTPRTFTAAVTLQHGRERSGNLRFFPKIGGR